MEGGQVKREHRAHREPAHKDRLAASLQLGQRPLGVAGPLDPLAVVHVLDRRPVAGQQRAGDGAALLMQVIPDQPHLWRRPGKAVDQQNADRSTLQEERRWIQVRVPCHPFPLPPPPVYRLPSAVYCLPSTRYPSHRRIASALWPSTISPLRAISSARAGGTRCTSMISPGSR